MYIFLYFLLIIDVYFNWTFKQIYNLILYLFIDKFLKKLSCRNSNSCFKVGAIFHRKERQYGANRDYDTALSGGFCVSRKYRREPFQMSVIIYICLKNINYNITK